MIWEFLSFISFVGKIIQLLKVSGALGYRNLKLKTLPYYLGNFLTNDEGRHRRMSYSFIFSPYAVMSLKLLYAAFACVTVKMLLHPYGPSLNASQHWSSFFTSV